MSRVAIALVALVIGMPAMADFADDFQAARKLLGRRKYADAEQAFLKLAASAPNAHGKAWSLSYAARALGLRKQYAKAVDLAKTIEPKSMADYTQMEVMAANRKPKDLIAAFKNENIAAWRDAINYKGFFLRGAAYASVGDRKAAVKDLDQCIGLCGSDAWVELEALNRVAALHVALGDDAKAMAAYEKVFALFDKNPRRKGRWLFPQALLGAARIRLKQGKYDEAKALLARFKERPRPRKGKRVRSAWDFLVLETYGDIAAAQGNKAEALAKYRDAVTIKTHKSYVKRVEEKIEALEKR